MASNFRTKIATVKAERDAAVEKGEKLKKRLRTEIERADESERELEQLEKQIGLIEEDLDEAEARAKELQQRAQATETEAEGLEHRAKRTSTLSGNDARRIAAMTAKYNVAVKRAGESLQTSRELEALVQQLEDDLVMAEDREADARRLNSDYEAELRQLTENARSFGTQGAKLNERESLLDQRVASLERKLAETEEHCEVVTKKEAILEEDVDRAEDERDQWKEEYRKIKEDYEQTMLELGDM